VSFVKENATSAIFTSQSEKSLFTAEVKPKEIHPVNDRKKQVILSGCHGQKGQLNEELRVEVPCWKPAGESTSVGLGESEWEVGKHF